MDAQETRAKRDELMKLRKERLVDMVLDAMTEQAALASQLRTVKGEVYAHGEKIAEVAKAHESAIFNMERRLSDARRDAREARMREAVKHGQMIEARGNQMVRRGDFDRSLDGQAMSIVDQHFRPRHPQESNEYRAAGLSAYDDRRA